MAPSKTLLLLALVLTCAKLSAQVDSTYSPTKTYNQSQLMADFEVLKDVLIEAHPSLYRHQSKAHFDSVLTNAKNQITGPMTEAEFWRVLQPVIVSIRSGHTDLYPAVAPVSWYINHPITSLPPSFYIRGDSLFIVRQKKDDTLRRIYPVKSINGKDSKQMIATLRRYVTTDGFNNQFADFKLQRRNLSEVYYRVYGQLDNCDVIAIDNDKEIHLVYHRIITPVNNSGADNLNRLLEIRKDELNRVVSVAYPPGLASTAILKITNFTYVNYYASFHQGFFKLMQDDKINNLVIDIRGNTGGRADVIQDLMRYLVDGKFMLEASEQVPTNKMTFGDYVLKDASKNEYVYGAGRVEKYDYRTRNFGYMYGYQGYNFGKNVYLLIDKGTFSAASLFAAGLKNLRKVTVIGEETGGCEAGADADYTTIKLPETGLLLHLPYSWLAVASRNPNSKRGIMPDVFIKPLIPTGKEEDIVMKKVKELILEKK